MIPPPPVTVFPCQCTILYTFYLCLLDFVRYRYLLLLIYEFRLNRVIFIHIWKRISSSAELSQSQSTSLVTWVCAKTISEKFSSALFWFTNLPFLKKFGSSQNFISQNIILIYLDYFIFYNKHLFYLTLKKKIVN